MMDMGREVQAINLAGIPNAYDRVDSIKAALSSVYAEGFSCGERLTKADQLDDSGWNEWARELLRVMPYHCGEDESAREVIEDWALKGARADTYPRGDAAWRELCVQRNNLWDEVVRRRRADTDPQPSPLIRPDAVIATDSPLDRQVGGDHYQGSAIQPIQVIQAWSLRYEAGAVLKYIYRAGKKGPVVEDLDKAIHYLELWRDDVIKNEEVGGG